MLPLLMAAISLLQNKQKQAEAQKQAKIAAAEGQAPTGQAQGSGQGQNMLSLLGGLKGAPDKGKQPDLSTAFQANGQASDPLSYNSVKDLNGIGIGSQAPSTEDDLSLLGS